MIVSCLLGIDFSIYSCLFLFTDFGRNALLLTCSSLFFNNNLFLIALLIILDFPSGYKFNIGFSFISTFLLLFSAGNLIASVVEGFLFLIFFYCSEILAVSGFLDSPSDPDSILLSFLLMRVLVTIPPDFVYRFGTILGVLIDIGTSNLRLF